MIEFEAPRRVDAEEAAVNLTPMIDMVFQLLIFFMLTSTYVRPAGLPLALPGAATIERSPDEAIRVEIDAGGAVFVDGAPLAGPARAGVEAEVRRRAGAAGGAAPAVVVRADRAAGVGAMVEVLDGARLGGARSVSVAAEPVPAAARADAPAPAVGARREKGE